MDYVVYAVVVVFFREEGLEVVGRLGVLVVTVLRGVAAQADVSVHRVLFFLLQ